MASTTVRDERVGGIRYIEISFTDADATTTHEVKNLPTFCTVIRYVADLISGTAATVNPTIGRNSAAYVAGGFDELGSDITGAPAKRVGTVAPNEIHLGPDRSLFVRPVPNAGADNEIRMEIQILDGWKK